MSTEIQKSDRVAVERTLRKLYNATGIAQPEVILWFDSPLAGAHARDILCEAGGTTIEGREYLLKSSNKFFLEVKKQLKEQLPKGFKHSKATGLGKVLSTSVLHKIRRSAMCDFDCAGVSLRKRSGESLGGGGSSRELWNRYSQIDEAVAVAIDTNSLGEKGGGVWGPSATLGRVREGLLGRHYFGSISVAGRRQDFTRFHQPPEVLGGNELELGWMLRAMAGSGYQPLDPMLWMYKDFAIMVEQPTALRLDNLSRLHCADAPALAYSDGFEVYSWHGTLVPKDFVVEGWGVNEILRERNAEVRRCAIEKMGWDVFARDAKLDKVGRTVDDPGNPGQSLSLYNAPRLLSSNSRILVCHNATPERDGQRHRFGLMVPNTISDPVEAAAWSFGVSKRSYLSLQRAT